MPFLVTPGSWAFALTSSMWGSKDPFLSLRPSPGSQPSAFQ